MCCVSGFVHTEPMPVSEAFSLLERTQHRGPDSVGIFAGGRVHRAESIRDLNLDVDQADIVLSHARLEIIGGGKGIQPISSCDEKLTLIHNGEIYNHDELRRGLERHRFISGSDGETLVHLIEEVYDGNLWKAVRQIMPLLEGMYAIAVTDGSSLVLARDPIGKKPLYFTDGFPMFFASERKALWPCGRKIRRLAPGQVLHANKRTIRVHQGSPLERPSVHIVDPAVALDEYEKAFDRAIARRIRSLDRIGVLFSGGVDSVLVARGAQLAGIQVTGYCVGGEGSTDIQAALQAAAGMKLPLRTKALTVGEVESLLPEIIETIEMNGPIQVEAAIPMYVAARMCHEDGLKVMLTGQAADELFAGYKWYRDVVRDKGYFALHERQWDDIEKLYLDTLEREDRMAMAHSIELRAPFLDRNLIRTAMSISPHLKIHGPDDPMQKIVHRELALRKGVPHSIAYREKIRAQDGTRIHGILKAIAARHYKGRKVGRTVIDDYGSNYRYLKTDYVTPEVSALMAEIAKSRGMDFTQFVEDAWVKRA